MSFPCLTSDILLMLIRSAISTTTLSLSTPITTALEIYPPLRTRHSGRVSSLTSGMGAGQQLYRKKLSCKLCIAETRHHRRRLSPSSKRHVTNRKCLKEFEYPTRDCSSGIASRLRGWLGTRWYILDMAKCRIYRGQSYDTMLASSHEL